MGAYRVSLFGASYTHTQMVFSKPVLPLREKAGLRGVRRITLSGWRGLQVERPGSKANDVLADGEGGGCPRRWGIQDVYGAIGLLDAEIIQEPTLFVYGLGPHSRPTWDQVCTFNLWEEPLEIMEKDAFHKRAMHLSDPGPPVFHSHCPKARVAQGAQGLRGIEVGLLVPLAGKSQHSVGSRFHLSMSVPCEVDTKEWEPGVWHRID